MTNKHTVSIAKSKLANLLGIKGREIMASTISTITQPNGVTIAVVRLLAKDKAISCRMYAGKNEYFGNEEFGSEDKNGFYPMSLNDVRNMFA